MLPAGRGPAPPVPGGGVRPGGAGGGAGGAGRIQRSVQTGHAFHSNVYVHSNVYDQFVTDSVLN